MNARMPLLTAFVGLAIAAPALATTSTPASKTVRYSDLDLSSKAGQATLDRRINQAVRVVCGTASSAALQDWLSVQKCYATARASV
jgi:UrcA family protein